MVGAHLDPIVHGLGVAELLVDRGDGVPSGYQCDVMCVGELKLRFLGSSLLRQSGKIYHFIWSILVNCAACKYFHWIM